MDCTQPHGVVALAVLATVVGLLSLPLPLHAADKGVSAETRLVDLPLKTASELLAQAAVKSIGVVDHLNKLWNQVSCVRIPMVRYASLDQPLRLNAEMTIHPCYDSHAVGLLVKVAF